MFFLTAKKLSYNKKYRIFRKNIFFTFPKSEITPEDLIKGLTTYWVFQNNIDAIIVGAEEHKDGSPHLHCLLMLKGSLEFYVSTLKEHLKIKHFNDAGHIRRIGDTLGYITKGGDVTTYPPGLNWKGMLSNARNKKSIKTDLILDAIKAVPHTTEIDDFITDIADTELGGFAAFRVKPITEFFKIYHGTKAKREHIAPCLPPSITTWILGQNHPTVTIWSWLQRVLSKGMKLGDRHLYIWGPTMSGKTSLIDYLMQLGWQIFLLPKNEDFFDGFTDKQWDLAIADEVRGGDQKVQFWNQWCDSWMKLKVKGKQAVLKAKVIPTILLSNYLPAELFPKIAKEHPDVLAAFERRWEVVSVGPGFGLIDLPK